MSEPGYFQELQPRAKIRVLLVDDDRLLRFQARHAMEKSGIDIVDTASGIDALDILEQQDFDVVLVDLQMPEMDGFTVCEEIRRIRATEFLPIIMLTGRDNRTVIRQAFRSGATDFESKPVDWLKLNRRIRCLADSRRIAMNLEAARHHHDALVDTIPDTLLMLDAHGKVLSMKPAIYGFDIQRLPLTRGADFLATLPANASRKLRRALVRTINGQGSQSCELELSLGQRDFYLEVRMVLAREGAAVAMIRDFSDRRKAEQKIEKLAFYDRVTELPNRLMMQKMIEQRIQCSDQDLSTVAVIIFDMLGFDHARSVLGNGLTEAILREIARRAQQAVGGELESPREELPLLGRIGDSRFAIALDDFRNRAQLLQLARKLRLKLEQRYILDDYEVNLSSRIGVAAHPGDDVPGDDLIEQASVALEHSDTTDHGGISFYAGHMRTAVVSRARLLKNLRLALENGELYLVYQPKIETSSSRLVGVEALLRWQDQSRGFVSPAEFIPLAEQNGLILSLGNYVLEEACRQSRSWSDDTGVSLPIAVNFSGHQLNHRGLVKHIERTLDRYAIGSDLIEIELTESVALEESGHAHSIVGDLNELGFKISIDDFGTGYSSFSSLQKLPFHTLKIDRSFIGDIGVQRNAGSIVEGIVNMAHALNMQVVAEGVEEVHQLEFLKQIRCDSIQGYLTGRPVPGDQIAQLLAVEPRVAQR